MDFTAPSLSNSLTLEQSRQMDASVRTQQASTRTAQSRNWLPVTPSMIVLLFNSTFRSFIGNSKGPKASQLIAEQSLGSVTFRFYQRLSLSITHPAHEENSTFREKTR